MGADAKEIIFTSGATESNNMAIKGIARFYGKRKRHVITTQTEHKCVLDSCRVLEQEGLEVTYLPVGEDGLVDVAGLERVLDDSGEHRFALVATGVELRQDSFAWHIDRG